MTWPARQPWRVVRRQTIVLHPDTGRPVDLATASRRDLDRCWTALETWANRHHGTLIATKARRIQSDIEQVDQQRRRAATTRSLPTEAAA